MPVVSIDWAKITERLDDVTALYALTHRQASLLLSLSEQLTWDKTYRTESYDPETRDAIDADVADLQLQLTMPTNLTDIIQYIDEVESLLQALVQHAGCCGEPGDITDGDQYTDSVTDGVGDVPQNIIDAGYATGASDWDGFYDYKCMISHVMITNMEWQLREFTKHLDSTGVIIGGVATVAAILGVILASGGTALVLGIIAAVAGAATFWQSVYSATDLGLEDLADEVNANHDALACAIYSSDGSSGAVVALRDAINTLWDPPASTILENLNLGPQLKALYAGRYDQQDIAEAMASNGYDPADYTCCPEDYGEYSTPMETGAGGTLLFMVNNGWTFSSGLGNPAYADDYGFRKPYNNTSGNIYATVIAARSATGLNTGTGMDMTINRISFDIMRTTAGAPTARLTIGADVSDHVGPVGTWTRIDYVPTVPVYRDRTDNAFVFTILAGGTSGYVHIDNVVIDFDGPN